MLGEFCYVKYDNPFVALHSSSERQLYTSIFLMLLYCMKGDIYLTAEAKICDVDERLVG